MRINVKGAKRDQLRRERQKAAIEREIVVDGEPLKQFYPCDSQDKHASRKADERKHGERRRISVALSNARYDDDAVILDDPTTAITRLQSATSYYA